MTTITQDKKGPQTHLSPEEGISSVRRMFAGGEVFLRGDYSPRSVLVGEISLRKDEKEQVTLELSEKFAALWTRTPKTTDVHIFRRNDRTIWYGKGEAGQARVDGQAYQISDGQYKEVMEGMAHNLGDLFYAHPGDVTILQTLDEVTGKQPDSLQRFLKVVLKFVD